MSSSLQNIPNGSISVYQSTSPSSAGASLGGLSQAQTTLSKYGRYYPQASQTQSSHLQHQIYETKSSSNINQTLSPLMRDASLSSRELNNLSGSNYLKSIGGPSSGSYHNNHNNTSPSTSSSASPPTTINNNGNNGSSRDGIYQAQPIYHRNSHYQRETTPTSGSNLHRSGGASDARELYGSTTSSSLQHQPAQHHKLLHHNIMTSSDSNLSKATRHELSLFDRIHSTSSSNESVCSSSSRDLNISHPYPTTGSQSQSHHITHHQLHQSPATQQHTSPYGSLGLSHANSGSTKQLNNWNPDYVPQTQPNSTQHQQPVYNELISSHNNNNNIPKKQQRNKELLRPKTYHQRDNW